MQHLCRDDFVQKQERVPPPGQILTAERSQKVFFHTPAPVLREERNETRKAKNPYRNKTEKRYFSGERRAARQGIK